MTEKQMLRKGNSLQRGIFTPRGVTYPISIYIPPPLIASEAAIDGGGYHQSYMAAVLSNDASKNTAFE